MADNPNIDAYVNFQNSLRSQTGSDVHPDSVGTDTHNSFNSVVGWGNAILPIGFDNTVLLDGTRGPGGYIFNVTANGTVTITDNSTSSATSGQTMSVSHAEYLIFNGGAAAATPGQYDSMVIIANGPEANLARLYQASFGRLPDLPGYEAWKAPLDAGSLTLQQAAQGFVTSAEFQAKIPATLADQDFVSALYTDVLGRAPDAAGLSAWTGYLGSLEAQTGSATAARATVLLGFATSGEEKARSAGWLVDTSQGGYADPGMPLDPKAALNAAATTKTINTGLLSPSMATLQSADYVAFHNAGFQITSTANETKLYASANNASITVTAPQVFDTNGKDKASGFVTRVITQGDNANVTLSGNGDQAFIYGDNTTVTLAHQSSLNHFYISDGFGFNTGLLNPNFDHILRPTNLVVIGFNRTSDAIRPPLATAANAMAPGQSSHGQITDINSALGPVNGANLDFAHNIYSVDLGDVGDGTVTSVARAAQSAYTPGGQSAVIPSSQTVFDPTKIIPGENITFHGHVTKSTAFANAGDDVVYSWGQFNYGNVHITPADGSAPHTQWFYGLTGTADVNGNHMVDAAELSFSVRLVGVDKTIPPAV